MVTLLQWRNEMGKYYLEDLWPLLTIFLFIIGIVLRSFIGEKNMEENLINSLCNKNQYDFCQPVVNYTRKEVEHG